MPPWDQAKLALTLATAGPWLYWQGQKVRRAVPQLPECFHPQGHLEGSGPPLRLVFLGDSIMAGIGHDDPQGILPAQLVKGLSEKTGRALEWQNLARNGADSAELVQHSPTPLPPADLYLVSVGVNDALKLRSPQAFVENLRQLSQKGNGAPWMLVGLPNLREFPCFPYPLSGFLAWRVSQLEEAALTLPSLWKVHRLRTSHTLDTFSPDGFHPGIIGCRSWASRLVPEVMEMLGVKQKRMMLPVIG
ncbi:MAG: SGNH/GDSL hydrolase family protein [Candidatus Eremiobacteraeota bacterium]|nr:SGNH/GDSL hydrolase family protein [Candidatus Eremiobacteraeota bacterium]